MPAPVLLTQPGNFRVYTREEIEAIAQALMRHETEYAYLCTDHTDTIKALRIALTRVRQQWS